MEVVLLTAVSTPVPSASFLTARKRGFNFKAFHVDIIAEKNWLFQYFSVTFGIVFPSLVQKYLTL
jgi:hypothetical protein